MDVLQTAFVQIVSVKAPHARTASCPGEHTVQGEQRPVYVLLQALLYWPAGHWVQGAHTPSAVTLQAVL